MTARPTPDQSVLDALADAETLKLAVIVYGNAVQTTRLSVNVSSALDAIYRESASDAAYYSRMACRAAFCVVPALRPEAIIGACRTSPGPCMCGVHRTELGDWYGAVLEGGR